MALPCDICPVDGFDEEALARGVLYGVLAGHARSAVAVAAVPCGLLWPVMFVRLGGGTAGALGWAAIVFAVVWVAAWAVGVTFDPVVAVLTGRDVTADGGDGTVPDWWLWGGFPPG